VNSRNNSTFRITFITFLLITIILICGACGPSAAPPAPTSKAAPSPGGNQPPIISSLTAAQMSVYPSGTVQLQCVAADPNGDKLNFTWSATGGNFSGAGSVITWQAPQQYGTYTITVTADDGKGASVQSSLTLSVGANQPPQISSFSANPAVVGPGGSSILTVVANDPDGDVVRYTWNTSEGNVTGVGNKVTWFAPNKGGSYNIIVNVNDGKGGESKGTVVVNVATATKSVTINVVQEETGTVSKTDKDKSKTRAGDDDKNNGYRAFWSYNIFSLNNTDVSDAKLVFTTKNVSGNPWTFTGAQSLGGLFIWRVSYTDQLPDFNISGSKLDKTVATIYEPPTVIDVTPEIVQLVQGAGNRFQIEAGFWQASNGNNVSEWIEWSDVKLQVTYTEK
jgi:hypothetical protein